MKYFCSLSFKSVEICASKPDHGPGDNHLFRYHYDKAAGTCKLFVWGGFILGNKNNFETKEECLEKCKGQ